MTSAAFIQQVASDDGLDIDLDNAVMDDAIKAISKVNKAITNLSDTDLTANANKGAFGLIVMMKDDIEQAARLGRCITCTRPTNRTVLQDCPTRA